MGISRAKWIWLRDAPQQPQTTALARRRFALRSRPRRAILAISASHIYRAYVNGKLVGRGPDRADPRCPYYDTYDIRLFLRRGENVILCLVHHMNVSQVGRAWPLYDGPAGFLAQLDIDGRAFPTDSSWKLTRAPGWLSGEELISYFGSFKHVVDLGAAREVNESMGLRYDDSLWPDASELTAGAQAPLPRPIQREIPLLVRTPHDPVAIGAVHPQYPSVLNYRLGIRGDPKHPLTILPGKEGAWLTMDFGRPMGGFPDLVFETTRGGGNVDLYYGEGSTRIMADRLTLPARGLSRFEPLDWRGARHVNLHFRQISGPVIIRDAHFVEMVYPYEMRGDFQCSDPILNQTWRICRETAWATTKDHPVDCLNREQALWIEDLCVHSRTITACFGDVRPALKGLRQALRIIRDDGVVPVPGPAGLGYKTREGQLPWSVQPLMLPVILRDIHRFTGDAQPVAECLKSFEKMFQHFARYEDRRGLLDTRKVGLPGLWAFGGWNPMLKDGVATVVNFQYVLGLSAAAGLASAIGRRSLATAWKRRAEMVREAARNAFWDHKRGLYRDGAGGRNDAVSATANAWAALGGGVRLEEAGAWAEALLRDPAIMPPVSPYDATLLLDSFVALGLDLYARDLLDRYYGSIVRMNEPTLPEFWSAEDATGSRYYGDMSRCHPYGSGPAYVLLHHVLGARADAPGWRRAVIEPHTLGLTRASGCVATPKGEIQIAWERLDTAWSFNVVLPAGIEAELRLSRIGWGDERLVLDGRTVWRAERWPALQAQAERTYLATPRIVICTLEKPGRHSIRLESF